MNCFTVTVWMDGERILFPRTWAETKVDACNDMMKFVKDFYRLENYQYAGLTASAKVNRDVIKGELL